MPPSPRRSYTYIRSRTARRELGRTLATELQALLHELDPDDPQRKKRILPYIQGLNELHPEWSGLWESGRQAAPSP